MYIIDILRKTDDWARARFFGSSPHHPRDTTEQHKAQHFHAEIRAYPSIYLTPVQDLDPSSDTFGQIYFIPGLDSPGDPRHPIAP